MRKLRLAIMCLVCAGLLVGPGAADAQKQRPDKGGKQRERGSAKCRIVLKQVTIKTNRLTAAIARVNRAKAKVAKRKAAYNKSKTKKNKRKLKKAKKSLKAAKAAKRAAQKEVNEANQRAAQRGCGG